ncbi:hypothetical protein A9R05_17230 [Burkholderia sp. KK1]|nr:hypothetical protein A9R05_17230 [Burkholderia sp. KK1]
MRPWKPRTDEEGRGFAVVAGEVRALAQRASVAAKGDQGTDRGPVREVQAGAEQAALVNTNMERVSKAIGQLSDVVGEISAASDEQSKGVAQIHEAITQIDDVTQQNAALVEQATAAAQSLREQAGTMKQDVGLFPSAAA